MSLCGGAGARRMKTLTGAAIGAVALGAVVIWTLVGRGGDSLATSSGDEVALRTARLAGVAHAVAGSSREVSVVRLDLAAPASAPDVGIAWLTGLGLLAGAHPGSERYVVQVFADGAPLIEYETPARTVHMALTADDSGPLRSGSTVSFIAQSGVSRDASVSASQFPAVDFVPLGDAERALALLSAAPEGATELPGDAMAIDLHLPGAYLDAKNRAAGLLGHEGLTAEGGASIAEAVSAARASAPAIAAPEPEADALAGLTARLRVAVEGARASGIDGLHAEVERLVTRGDRDSIARAQSLVASAEALSLPGLDQSLAARAADVALSVRETPLREGPPSDAVRTAAGDGGAPRDSVVVREFDRDASLDMRAVDAAVSDLLPARVLRLHGRGDPPTLEWRTAEGGGVTTADAWLAHRRADGTVFWLAGEDGDVALVDASIRGWAYTTVRAALVDASRCGRVLAHLSAE